MVTPTVFTFPTVDPTLLVEQPTVEIETSKLSQVPNDCGAISKIYIATDKSWAVFSCFQGADLILELTTQDGKKWSFTPKQYLAADDQEKTGSLRIAGWSQDNKRLYFTSNLNWDGTGVCTYGPGSQGLFSVNLQTGQVDTLLPAIPATQGDWGSIAFTAAGDAFVYDRNGQMVIHSLADGVESKSPMDKSGKQANFLWAADGQSLVYWQCVPSADGKAVDFSELIQYTLKDQKSVSLLKENAAEFHPYAWGKDNLIHLVKVDWTSMTQAEVIYDLNAGMMVTPTPAPMQAQ
jgi:hypothetical protein